MITLLHISASPRGDRSESIALADAFLAGVAQGADDVEVEHWDLWDGTLPAFGSAYAHAKMTVFAGEQPTGAQGEAWSAVQRTFARFAAADAYLFSVPMWNAGVPYILKQLVDVVSQPGMVFDLDPAAGYTGLVTGRRAVVAYTSAVFGVGRPAPFGSDFQSTFLEDWLRWAGFTDIESVEFRPNLAVADADRRRVEAHRRATDLGRTFSQRPAAA